MKPIKWYMTTKGFFTKETTVRDDPTSLRCKVCGAKFDISRITVFHKPIHCDKPLIHAKTRITNFVKV